ncbi:MAG: hypothetical protein IJH71_08025 [Eubacterium sp.]|nr:hypothetical protein [Eubacterium sp.]
MKNNITSKTVIFDISDMLAARVVMKFEKGDYDDEQVEYLARLHFAATQGDRFFERADIINYASTNDVEIYGKKFAFTKFKEELLDEKTNRVLNSFMVIKIEDGEFKPLGIVEVSSMVDRLDDPFQCHLLSQYEGISPCTAKDLAEFTVLLPKIRFYEMTNRNNMLDWNTVYEWADGTEIDFENLTKDEQVSVSRAILNDEYNEFSRLIS